MIVVWLPFWISRDGFEFCRSSRSRYQAHGKDFVQLGGEQTVSESLQKIREQQPEGRIIYFYVADGEGRLIGVVPTRRLLLSPPDSRLDAIMVKQVIAIPQTATVLEACEFFTLHRLLAFPVLDENLHIVGLVDVDLYTTELQELERRENTEDLFQLIGVHLTESQERVRLGSPFGSGFLGCSPTWPAEFWPRFFRVSTNLSYKRSWRWPLFIPVVLALAESVSMQSVSLCFRIFTANDPPGRPWREGGPGTSDRFTSGSLRGARALLESSRGLDQSKSRRGVRFRRDRRWCGLCGVDRSGDSEYSQDHECDPQVAAGPIALALADMATLVIYFNLARQLLS